ncbi:MAG: BrnT family toxin [Caldilineaceae bacterium]
MIIIDEFIWAPQIVEKLLNKHLVSPEEVEEVFFNRPQFRFHERGHVQGEDMYTALGQSNAGRYLIIFFLRKPLRKALIISARDMVQAERQRYERK